MTPVPTISFTVRGMRYGEEKYREYNTYYAFNISLSHLPVAAAVPFILSTSKFVKFITFKHVGCVTASHCSWLMGKTAIFPENSHAQPLLASSSSCRLHFVISSETRANNAFANNAFALQWRNLIKLSLKIDLLKFFTFIGQSIFQVATPKKNNEQWRSISVHWINAKNKNCRKISGENERI